MTELQQIKLLSNEEINTLRASWSNHIRKLFIKEQCEICGCKDNLELHHLDKSFSVLVNESIDILGIDENNLTNKFDILKMYLLGVQVKIQYQTLCSKCHDKVHILKVNKAHRIRMVDKLTKEEINKSIYNNIDTFLDRPLTKEDKDSLCEYLNLFDERGRLLKWTRVKKLLKERGFKIQDKTIRDKTTKKHTKVSIITKDKKQSK